MTDNESIADRIAREAREKDQRRSQASKELGAFLDTAIDHVMPQVDSTIRAGLQKVFDNVGPNQIQRGNQKGERILQIGATSKGGMHASVVAKITGKGPIVDNPHNVHYDMQIEGFVNTSNGRTAEFKIAPDADHTKEPVVLVEFIAATFETKIRDLYR
jgi:hypothetical protein